MISHVSQSSETPWLIHRFNSKQLNKVMSQKNYLNRKLVLKDYQKDGIEWLLKADGRIMADDMGLGKTLQSIAAATKLIVEKKVRNILIICPSSLVRNWSDEFSKWAPDFCVQTITNTGSKKNII